ncbi:hypothetical protein [Polyangium spumosum]|uniref:Uncharacterized protein n=1 Tax=Polyangium spumosum TaxID=889282 RepID=A0A6N7PST4_9BACT|nr:hypothetical protein [Polyangium spumosum]MRG93440.1 hypothetical protein [Polyangium spumosum]
MFVSNAHYGHRTILNRHGGVPDGTPIPGMVEHGWNYDLGATHEDILHPFPDPFYVWSERNLRNCRKAGGLDHVVPLGAPFLYLPPLEETIEAEPGSLLVMPIHGWERSRVLCDFDQYVQDLAEIERHFRSITVCLYYFEHREERFRRPFEARGYEVVTSGPRDNNPTFLHDLRRLLLRHEYVSTNRAQTATFYALHLGRKVFLHGPAAGVEQRLDPSGQLYQAWQSLEFPMLLWKNFKDETYPQIGADELGLPFVRTRQELRELFLWQPEQRRAIDARASAVQQRNRERIRARRIQAWQDAFVALPYIGRHFSRVKK